MHNYDHFKFYIYWINLTCTKIVYLQEGNGQQYVQCQTRKDVDIKTHQLLKPFLKYKNIEIKLVCSLWSID